MDNKYISNLNWRYAVKKFDSNKKLSVQDLDVLKEAIRLAPSSFGLMPYKVVVTNTEEIKNKLVEAAHGQTQLLNASHIFVFAAKNSIDIKYVEDFVESVSTVREVPAEALTQYKNMIIGFMTSMSEESQRAWSDKQAYIGLSFLLDAAAQNEIDACPMEGFVASKVDEILGLSELGLHSAVLCPVGFRSTDDPSATAKKVRFSKDQLFISK